MIVRRGGTLVPPVVLVLVITAIGSAQQPAPLTFHDLSTMARHPLGRMQARGAMGQTGSIMMTELPPGLKTTPHHHHQEQMMLGLAGGMHYQMAGKPYPLGRLTAAIALANVEHGNINETTEPATCIEFQAVLRPDWFPPHPRRPREGAPAPIAIPAGRTVTEEFSGSTGWRTGSTGARSKSLSGDTIRVTLWDLAAATAPVDLTAGPAVERFVFVIDGQASIAEGTNQRAIAKDMLVIVSPSAKNVTLRSIAKGNALLAVFESLVP
jgi:quercetin dioxygenase-like cupin family protein